MRIRDWTASPRALGLTLLALGCAACGDDDQPVVVGSEHVVERVEAAMYVEKVRVSMPLRALVYNGEPKQVLLRGEDNLLALIEVVEEQPKEWSITAPDDLKFEQHQDIRIEVPYLDMVFLSLSGDVDYAENPSGMWRRDAGPDAGEPPAEDGGP